MGLFNFFKSKKADNLGQPSESSTENNPHIQTFIVDGLYKITTVSDFKKVEGDRFRLATEDDKTQMSISNYLSSDNMKKVDSSYLKELVLPLYQDYKENGGYEPIDDLIIAEDHISQSFKVDNETQYYLTTVKQWDEKIVITTFIIRDLDRYREDVRKILFYTFYKMAKID